MSLTFPATYTSKGVTKPLPNPSRPITEGIKTNTLVFTADSGHEQRRMKGDPRRTFEFSYVVLTLPQAEEIESFFFQVLNVNSFLWTHPVTKVQYLTRFDMDTFQKEMFGHSKIHGPLYKVSVKLIQVL